MTDAWNVCWDGTDPDDIIRRIREDVGVGRATCVWGGMEWRFRVLVDREWTPVNYGDWLIVNPVERTVRVAADLRDPTP